MILYLPFPQRADRHSFIETTHRVPRQTTLPLPPADAIVTVLVDDENVRLAAELELGGLIPDYHRLARVCAGSFRSAEVHVFTARSADDEPFRIGCVERAEIRVHRKRVGGKNVDMDVALWLALRLYSTDQATPTHVLFVTGDVDYLTLAAAASDHGAEIGFLAAPGRSLAHALRSVPHGLLGRDVLVRTRSFAHRSSHGRRLSDNGWRPPSPRRRPARFSLDGERG